MNLQTVIKDSFDVLAGSVAFAVILKLIPAIAGLLTIVWTGVRLYDRFKGKDINGNE